MKKRGNFPPLVEAVIRQWETLAFGAYEAYLRYGLVAMSIQPSASDPERVDVGVKTAGELPADAVRQLEEYNPDTEVVVEFTEGKRATPRWACLKAPTGKRSPREVWTEEMLTRAATTPDSIDWNAMPAWFVLALAQAGLSEQA